MARITISGVDASGSTDFALPVSGASYFGVLTSAGLFANDLSGGAATVVGSPMIVGGAARFTSYSNYIETGAPETASIALVTVSRAVGIRRARVGRA